MKRKVQRISGDLAARLGGLPGVDSIVLAEIVGDDFVDPYFFFSLDVYYRGTLPDEGARRKLFSDAGAFESSSVAAKDRFLIEEFPVRIQEKLLQYRQCCLYTLWYFDRSIRYPG